MRRTRDIGNAPQFRLGTRHQVFVAQRRRLRDLAPGLTPRSVLEKFGTMQMLDVHLPTTDERTVVLSRYTQPGTDVQLLLQRMRLELPAQPPPRITAPKPAGPPPLW